MSRLYRPDLVCIGGEFRSGIGVLVGDDGRIEGLPAEGEAGDATVERMPGRALLPGLVNAHSHSFQRLIRGAAEHSGPSGDDFWAWRNTMYRAALGLDPDDLFDAARMAFLEMALSGITAVGEFHYLHRRRDGSAYPDPNLLARRVIDAARSVGLRICLLRVAYERAGAGLDPHPGQIRFCEPPEEYLENAAALLADLSQGPPTVSMGVAPHSVRAVPLASLGRLVEWARERGLVVHMHAAEQPAEIQACQGEHGLGPIALLASRGLLSGRMTLVHAIHTTPAEVDAVARAGTTICSCPTTERNLGDGIIAADEAIARGVPFCFGTDSQANIHLLEDARQLDYHLRLRRRRRLLIDGIGGEDISVRLLRYATGGGAASLGLDTGRIEPGHPADLFSIDLGDVSIAGVSAPGLTPMVVFGLERGAIRDVVVHGRMIVRDGHHPQAEEIVGRYAELAARVESQPW